VRQITALILLLTLAFPFVMRVGIVGHYFANKNYYATVLCVNKDNAELDCKGSCQLQQKLKNVSERGSQKKGQLPQSLKKQISPYILYDLLSAALPHTGTQIVLYKNQPESIISKTQQEFFHPPELAA
jgi:hypothetical protein